MDTASRRMVSLALCLAVAAAGALFAGCAAPPATVELVNVARQALADASELADARRADDLARLDELAGALDAGFDADVRLVAAGGLIGPDGQPVGLSPEWVISARKGYAAARGALADQRGRPDRPREGQPGRGRRGPGHGHATDPAAVRRRRAPAEPAAHRPKENRP